MHTVWMCAFFNSLKKKKKTMKAFKDGQLRVHHSSLKNEECDKSNQVFQVPFP